MADEAHLPPVARAAPNWVIDLVKKHGGYELQFLMEKTLVESEVYKQRYRLEIPSYHVEAHVLPMLSEDEKVAANILDGRGDDAEGTDVKKKKQQQRGAGKGKGREHQSIGVRMYVRSGWWFRVALTRWDSRPTLVVKGDELRMARIWGELKSGDAVKMWGFRKGPNRELCFVIAKKTMPNAA